MNSKNVEVIGTDFVIDFVEPLTERFCVIYCGSMNRTRPPARKRYDFDPVPIREAYFIEEYLRDFDLDQAAIRAGVVSEGWDQYAREAAIRKVLSRVRDELSEAVENRRQRIRLTDDKMILEMASIAFHDPSQMFNSDGELLPFPQMPDAIKKSIKEINFKRDKDGAVYPSKIGLHDKMSALQTLMKQAGSLGPDNVNYNYQFNQQINQYNQQANIRLEDLSDQDVESLRKLIGEEDLEEALNLQQIEKDYA